MPIKAIYLPHPLNFLVQSLTQGRIQRVFQGGRGGKNLGPKGDGDGRKIFDFLNLSRRVFRPLFNDFVVFLTGAPPPLNTPML